MQTTCGTVDYVAPEIVEGYVYTQAVDLWACGVITYALLSGTLPFTDTSKGRMFKRIREGAYQFDNEIWKDVSDSAKDFISHLICVDTTKRFSAEKALQHGWIALTTNSN
jgi:serine/threonine protein kinase